MYENIDKNLTNGENMAGIAQTIYYGLHADVLNWPAKPQNPLTLDAAGKLTGNIEFKPGKCMFKTYLTDDTGEIQFEPVGPKDGKSFVVHLRFFHPGLKSKILGFMNAVKNENMVFIVPDNNGQYFILGDLLRPATYEGAGDGAGTGKETSGSRGIGMEFTYKVSNLYEYTGTIPLTPAASGSF